MGAFTQALGDVVENIAAFIVMLVLAILSFFLTVFIVSYGSGLAGYAPSGDFVVLSASLIVSATVLSGVLK